MNVLPLATTLIASVAGEAQPAEGYVVNWPSNSSPARIKSPSERVSDDASTHGGPVNVISASVSLPVSCIRKSWNVTVWVGTRDRRHDRTADDEPIERDVRRLDHVEVAADIVVEPQIAPRLRRAIGVLHARDAERVDRLRGAADEEQQQRLHHRCTSAGSSPGDTGEYDGLPDIIHTNPPIEITGAATSSPVPIMS